MKKSLQRYFPVLLIALVMLFPAWTLGMQSPNYRIDEDSVNFGGTEESGSANYRMSDTLGEVGTGEMGQRCSSLDLDAVDDYVSIPTAGASAGTGTVSFWMKKTDTGNSGYVVATSGTAHRIYFYSGAANLYFNLGGNNDAIGSTALTTGQWNHVVGVWNNGTGSFYLNGQFVSSHAYTALGSVQNPMTLGGFGGASQMYKGRLDDVRFYSRALTAEEISNLYKGNQIDKTGLVADWTLDEQSGMVANDLSGSGNNGTITSATYGGDYPISTCHLLYGGYRQMFPSTISLSGPANIVMSPSIGGLSGGTGNGSGNWSVMTDNPAGYQMNVRATTSPALLSGAYSFADYTPNAAGIPDLDWGISAADSEFGYTVEGGDTLARFRDDGSACNAGAGNVANKCWLNLSTSDRSVAGATSSNQPYGTNTTLKFRAQSGTGHVQAGGGYTATVVVTALEL